MRPTRLTAIAILPFAIACAPAADETAAPAVAAGEASAPTQQAEPPSLVVDFGAEGDTSWFAQNDTVMGGVSEGIVDYTSASFVFEGYVSTENNGGFASVRSPYDTWNLSKLDTLVVRYRSTGQPFTLTMADTPNWWEGEFRYDLAGTDGEWVEEEIALSDFEFWGFNGGYSEPTGEFMRRPDRKAVVTIQFMSKQFEDGDFVLEVDHLSFW